MGVKAAARRKAESHHETQAISNFGDATCSPRQVACSAAGNTALGKPSAKCVFRQTPAISSPLLCMGALSTDGSWTHSRCQCDHGHAAGLAVATHSNPTKLPKCVVSSGHTSPCWNGDRIFSIMHIALCTIVDGERWHRRWGLRPAKIQEVTLMCPIHGNL